MDRTARKDKRGVKEKKHAAHAHAHHAKQTAWSGSAVGGGAAQHGLPLQQPRAGPLGGLVRPSSAPVLGKDLTMNTKMAQLGAYRNLGGVGGGGLSSTPLVSADELAPPPQMRSALAARPKVHVVGGGGGQAPARWSEVATEGSGVTRLEMLTGEPRRDGPRTGIMRLAPHCTVPIRTEPQQTLVFIVMKGRVATADDDSLTPKEKASKKAGKQPVLRQGECLVAPPGARFQITAGDVECEIFYTQETYPGEAGGGTGSGVPGDTLAAAAAARPADSIFSPVDDTAFAHLCDKRRGHKDYVHTLRAELQRSQQFELYTEASIRRMYDYYKVETTARHEVVLAEAIAFEEVTREITAKLEAIAFEDVHAARRKVAYLPWCSLGCRYCCKLQHELYQQMSDIAMRETQLLVSEEAQVAHSILREEEIEWKDLTTTAWCAQLQLCVFVSGRQQLWRKAKAAKLLVQLEEKRAALDLSHAMHLSHENARFNDDSWALKKQHIELCRFSDLLSLREDQLHTEQLNGLERMETNKRECMEQKEDDVRTCLAYDMEKEMTILLASHAESRVRIYKDQVEVLEKYKRDREAEDEEKARTLHEEEQATLTAEMDAIKARSGKGKNKPKLVIPESVAKTEQCDRCGSKVTKSTYAKHIDKECSWRPTDCKLCGILVRVKDMSDHVTSACQSREEECPECGEYYQARSIPMHLGLCSRLQEAKDILPTLRPDLGIEVIETDEGLKIKSIKKETALESVADVDDVILFINERTVPTTEKFHQIVEGLCPGQEITITLKAKRSAGARGGPWWGGTDSAEHQHTVLNIIVETSIPLEEFHELNDLVTEDSGLRSAVSSFSPVSTGTFKGMVMSEGGLSTQSKASMRLKRGRATSSAGSRG